MSTAASWRSSPVKRLQAAAISAIGYRLAAALGSTLKWRVEGLHHYDAIVLGGHQPIMAFWHGRILPATIYFRNRGIVVITSENFDGEWIAGIIERFGYGTARGSTSRGGRKALVQMVRDMEAGKPTGFTLDGPRGPARVAQAGAVWLSKATGNPVLPFHVEADRHWTINSWDQTQIPKPPAAMSQWLPFVTGGLRGRAFSLPRAAVASQDGECSPCSSPCPWCSFVAHRPSSIAHHLSPLD